MNPPNSFPIRALISAVAFAVLSSAFGQAPPNDNFTNRLVLTGMTATARGTNTYATRETGEPAHAGSPAVASLWWTWQAPYDGVVQFTVTNAGYVQTRWAWYTGTALTNLSVMATNRATTNRVVEINVLSNTVYQIAVDRLSYSSTIFTLQLAIKTLLLAEPTAESRVPSGTPVNLRVISTETDHPLTGVDYYVSSNLVASTTQPPFDAVWPSSAPGRYYVFALASNSIPERRDSPLRWINVVPSNDFFAGPSAIPSDVVSYQLAGENSYATAEPGEPAHAGRRALKSLWWSWTPAYSGLARFTVTSRVTSPSVAIYTGDTLTNLTLVAANTNSAAPLVSSFNAEAGTTYRIAVDGTFLDVNGAVRVQLDLTTLRFVNVPRMRARAGDIVNLAITNYETDHPFETLQVLIGTNVVADAVGEPWVLQWVTNVPGAYTFTCMGTNSNGELRVSDALTVIVSPANDDIADASEIPSLGDQISSGESTTVCATSEADEPLHYGSNESGSVWFVWTAPWSGRIYFSTEGSSPGTFVGVYSGESFTNLTRLSDPASAIASVRQGVRYYIAVITANGATGPVRVTIYPPAANNDFADAIDLSGSSGIFSGSNYSANAELGEPVPANDSGTSIWWRWTAPTFGDFSVSLLDTGGNPVIYAVYVGGSVSNLTTAVPPRSIALGWAAPPSFRARPGWTYYFRVSGHSAYSPYCTFSAAYSFMPLTNAPPVNDYFDGRVALSGTTNFLVADNTFASIEPGEPAIGGYPCTGKSLWWSFTATEKGVLQVFNSATNYGTAWAIFRGDTLNTLTLAQANWGPNPIRVDLEAGEQVQIVADGTFGASGPMMLQTAFFSVPVNDAFAHSIHLLETNVSVSGEAFAASVEPGEYLVKDFPNRTVWYSWAAPANGQVTLNTWAVVYTGSAVENLKFIKGGWGVFTFMAEEGRIYHFQIAGGGWYSLSLSFLPCAGPPNDNFTNAYNFILGDYTYGWMALATAEPAEPPHLNGPFKSIWWRYEAPINGTLDVWRVEGSATNVVFAIYSGSSVDSLTLLNKGTNRAMAPITCRSVYYIAVASDPSCDGEIVFRGGLTGFSTPAPIPGNLLCDSSFETGSPNCWHGVGPNVLFMNVEQSRGPMDGQYYLALSAASSVYQDFATVPGRSYQVRFAYCANINQTLPRVEVRWDSTVLGQVSVLPGEQTKWKWAQFSVIASNTTSRLTVQNRTAVDMDYMSVDCASVLRMDEPPSITQQPGSLSALEGGTAALNVLAAGTAPLAYQWWFADAPLPGATRMTLGLNCVTTNQAGDYFVVVTNAFGAVTSAPARLVVDAPGSPTIVLQPYSDKVPVGAYFALSVAAVGAPPLVYQWFFNGSALPDATNRHVVFPSFQITNVGTYFVRVANLSEAVISLPATLTATTNERSGALVLFANSFQTYPGTIQMPIFDADGITALNSIDSDYVAQLYAGLNVAELRPVSSLRPFLAGFDAGYFSGEYVSPPNMQAGTLGYYQVRAWQREYGLGYEEARALGSKFGRSEIFTCYAGGQQPGLPPTPARNLDGWHSFSLHAGMPQFIVGRIEVAERQPDGTVLWSLQGQAGYLYLIERCTTNLIWRPLIVLTNSTGITTFSDPAPPPQALYRARILE